MAEAYRVHPQFGHVALCDGPKGLTAIRDSRFNLVIWERAVPPVLSDTIASAPYSELYSLPRDGPKPPWNRWFSTVLWDLKKCVAAAIGSPDDRIHMDIRVQRGELHDDRLDVQYFHRDGGDDRSGIRYRAIVHLYGPPTLWLPEDAPRKKVTFVESPSIFTRVRYLSTMHWTQEMPSGSLCLFRGQRMGMGSGALLHRAPRKWTGKRLTVALDCWS